MGFFDRLRGAKIDNIELANQALKTFGMGGEIDEAYRKPVEKFLSQFDSRIEKLKGIAKLCGDDKSPKALYIKSTAYSWAGASTAKEAAESTEEYLKDPTGGGLPDDIIHFDDKPVRRQDAHRAMTHMQLGEKYEQMKLFDSALKEYEKCKSLNREFYGIALKIADVYRKMNDLDKAISVLEEAKRNPLLKPRIYKTVYDGGFTTENTTADHTTMFDSMLEDFKKKKERGYIYRPRTKK